MPVPLPHQRGFNSRFYMNAVGQLVMQLNNLSYTLEVPADDIWAGVLDDEDYFPTQIIRDMAIRTVFGLIALHRLPNPPGDTFKIAEGLAREAVREHPNYDSWEEPG